MFAHSWTKKSVVRATGDIVHQFQGQKVKGQCHQMDNAVTGNEPYLCNGKAYKLLIWYTETRINVRKYLLAESSGWLFK